MKSAKRGSGRPRNTNGVRRAISQPSLSGSTSASSDVPQTNQKKLKTVHHTAVAGRNGRLGYHSGSNEVIVTDHSQAVQDQLNETREELDSVNDETLTQNDPHHVQIQAKVAKARPKVIRADRLQHWLPFRQAYLDELIRHDGLGSRDSISPCLRCASARPDDRGLLRGRYRCRDCHNTLEMCAQCVVDVHSRLPLHRIVEWTGAYFKKTSLRALGLVIYLGHGGLPCSKDTTVSGKKHRFTICDLSGLHDVDIVFCDCYNPNTGIVKEWQQLFRAGWYPATHNRPSTAFTFAVLDFFYELTHQGKSNLYDFHKTLERITDNSGTVAVPSVYRQLSDVMRQWRNLMLLKRSGRAYDPDGIDATEEGECALECPACPHPGRNLPDDWDKAPPHVAWIYVLFLMLDANFRLKLKDRGFRDTELTKGWAYFVESSKYSGFVNTIGEQKETNSCSAEHNAIKNANNKHQGYLVSGAAACLCNRHGIVRANGVADLEKGERYSSMDYILLASLSGTQTPVLVSYDIACQYHKNFLKRNADFPPCMQLDTPRATTIRWVIPKKHWPNHGRKNHSQYSLNYVPYVGRTYGEGIEASWAHMNQVSMSTKEMAPPSRREVLDSHWGAWNWNKIRTFGPRLSRLLREALAMKAKHEAAFDEFSKTFAPETLAKWQADIERWENDPKGKFDPFDDEVPGVTLSEIKLKLANEDAADAARGIKSAHEVTPAVFLLVGLEIEEQQRSLAEKKSQGRQSVADRASLQRKLNALAHRITSWRKVQTIYMPAVQSLVEVPSEEDLENDINNVDDIDDQDDQDSVERVTGIVNPDQVPLWLPSSLPSDLRSEQGMASLMRKECELRMAQADDALADIRRIRRIMAGIGQFKMLNISGSGQKANTRARNLYDKFKSKELAAANRYRAAFSALGTLDPNGDWSTRLRPLLAKDLRGPGKDDDTPLGEGRHEVSWIWLAPKSLTTDSNEPNAAEFNRTMQAEWSKSRARARRWSEETILLQEEMRRVLAFFEWKAHWWTEQVGCRAVSADIASGLSAYAAKQASMYLELAAIFGKDWTALLRANGMNASWANAYAPQDGAQTDRQSGKRGARIVSDDDSSSSDSDSDSGVHSVDGVELE